MAERTTDRADQRVFYAPSIRAPVLWLGLLSGAVGLYVSTQLWSLSPLVAVVAALGSSYVAIRNAVAIRNLSRPLIELSEGAIEHHPLLGLTGRKLSRTDVARVAESTARRVVLQMESGTRETIRLQWLAKPEQSVARAAIERWVADGETTR